MAQLVLGIAQLHKAGMTFREFKPENIRMDEDGYLCIDDFGYSRFIEEDKKKTSALQPIVEYHAPEVIASDKYFRGSDWWTLGVILYEMLVGILPFYSQIPKNVIQPSFFAKPVTFPDPMKYHIFVTDLAIDLISRVKNFL